LADNQMVLSIWSLLAAVAVVDLEVVVLVVYLQT
jgi:hypothetical protein